jgi:hypothetical protein
MQGYETEDECRDSIERDWESFMLVVSTKIRDAPDNLSKGRFIFFFSELYGTYAPIEGRKAFFDTWSADFLVVAVEPQEADHILRRNLCLD